MDTARTPYGDGNFRISTFLVFFSECSPHPSRGRQPLASLVEHWDSVGCNPHPLRGRQLPKEVIGLVRTRCNPHPLRGRQPTPGNVALKCACRMQPAPLTGTATVGLDRITDRFHRMQPAPLTGTATDEQGIQRGTGSTRYNPHPSRGRQLNGVLVELLVVQM